MAKIMSCATNCKRYNQTVRSVNDLNMSIKDFEHSAFEIEKENQVALYLFNVLEKRIM